MEWDIDLRTDNSPNRTVSYNEDVQTNSPSLPNLTKLHCHCTNILNKTATEILQIWFQKYVLRWLINKGRIVHKVDYERFPV